MALTRSQLALIFLRLGATAFGGPAAHIAMMRREFVDRRGLIDRERFTDMLGVVNLIPGPNSTELAVHVGAELGGTVGLWIAGICFIFPAFSIVLLLAWLYAAHGTVPDVGFMLAGVKPVVLAVIAHAVWNLGAGIVRRPAPAVIACCAFALGLVGLHELLVLFGSGLAGAGIVLRRTRRLSGDDRSGQRKKGGGGRGSRSVMFFAGGFLSGLFGAPTLWGVFFYFLYVGSVLYGSGYVLVAFLRDDLVVRLGWLTQTQLLDAISIGQVTPGPVLTTATFVGYLVAGVPGGVVATLGIFLPSFLFVLVARRWISPLRSRPPAAGFLDGVNAGAVALIGVVLITLVEGSLVLPIHWGIALAALTLLILTRVNPTWLIAAGALIGWAIG